MPNVIELNGVRKEYAQTEGPPTLMAVASLGIVAGERVALMGASGSGKTTLLNLIGGLVAPDSGSVRVIDTDITQLREAARDRFRARHIGCLFQSHHLLEGFNALENVELGASFTGRQVDRAHAKELLEAVGLGHRLRHQPSQMSVGQQARVALARALVNRPEILLADEPTGALDHETGDAVLQLIIDRAEADGITLVVATHDPRVAQRLGRTVRVEELA